jgi:hypothetical protein
MWKVATEKDKYIVNEITGRLMTIIILFEIKHFRPKAH